MTDSLAARASAYRNEAAINDALHAEFARLADSAPYLKRHRDWVEARRFGFGDRAFHYMWFLVLSDLAERGRPGAALEIGVYKGQVLSLWALIAGEIGLDLTLAAISPFAGNRPRVPRLVHSIRKRIDKDYARAAREGNLYDADDYLARVREIFAAFDLDFAPVEAVKGLSNDPAVVARLKGRAFDLLYVDGDHSYDGARFDIETYGALVAPDGYMVLDDAGFFLPGQGFWKGHEAVSRAAEAAEPLGFVNILNVGHNRVYRRLRP